MPWQAELFRVHRPGTIANGNWDRDVPVEIRKTPVYRSFKRRFENGTDWSETEYYEQIRSGLPETTWHNLRDERAVLEKLRSYDDLYASIRDEGYRTQKSLREAGEVTKLKMDALNEVKVNIGRDGELILDDGRHRFVIARLLGMDQIPVCIQTRHLASLDSISKPINPASSQ